MDVDWVIDNGLFHPKFATISLSDALKQCCIVKTNIAKISKNIQESLKMYNPIPSIFYIYLNQL